MIYVYIILLLLFGFIIGISKAITDTLSLKFDSSIFFFNSDKFDPSWWDPDISCENKNKPKNKYMRLLTRTVFVVFTDAIHLFMGTRTTATFGIAIISYILASNIWTYMLIILLTYLFGKLVFEISFKKISNNTL